MRDILIQALCYISIIILGYVLRKRGFFGENAFPVLSNIVLKITLPGAIISSSSGRTVDPAMLTLSLLGFVSGMLYLLLAALLHRKKNRDQLAFALLNTPGYNIGAFAMPFTQGFLGPMGVITTSLYDIGNAFICLGGAFGVASAVKAGEGFNAKRVFRALSRSIPFLCYLLMVTLNLGGWTLPAPILSFAGIVGNANPFMAMLMIGVGFELSADRSKLGTMARILITRYALAAVLALVYYFVLPFDLEIRQALVILAFSPISAAVPGFTAELKEDVGLSSAMNSISIIIGIVVIVALLLVML